MVALTGTVQAQNEVNLSFRIDGRLIERTVDIGDSVRPGQLIARLDPQNEESGVQSVRAQIAGANAQLLEARNNFERMRDLVVEAAVSRTQYDQAEAHAAVGRVAGRGAAGAGRAWRRTASATRASCPRSPAWSRRADRSPARWCRPGA